MDPQLKLVTETGNGCLILRDLRGCYVVRHPDHHREFRGIATLAGAYASCRQLEPALAHQPG